MTVEEFVRTTHARLHDTEHFKMHLPLCGKKERDVWKQFAEEHKSEILRYLHHENELQKKKQPLEIAVKKIRRIEKIWETYDYEFQNFLKSDENSNKPKLPPITVKEAISLLTPKEQAYLMADKYAQSENFQKAEIGAETKEKIADCDSNLPEVYEDMIQMMKERWLQCTGKNY